jgi:S-formylglutathione hydrolase FrmB
MKIYLFAFSLFFLIAANASVDTGSIFSNSMHKTIKTVVIKPSYYNKSTRLPTVYLLHGYSGNYADWIRKVPTLQQLADDNHLMIVCPDGGFSSWYFDSPIDSTYRYETFVAIEVPGFIDAHYTTIANRKGRAITGLSMGGHGGLFLGYRHADIFGACGSMSGGVDLNFSRNKFDVVKRIGDTITHAENWSKYSVINVVDNYPNDSIAIIFDCGVDDFFYEDNKALHKKLVAMKVKHDYIERPGKHDWKYWGNSVEYQLYFFKKYFESQGIVAQ